VFGPGVKRTVDLGIRPSMSDVAATLAEVFSVEPPPVGQSFLAELVREKS
jgi:phosphopentomutase